MTKEAIQEIAAMVARVSPANFVADGGTPYTVLPPGHTVADLGKLLKIPARKAGTVFFTRPESFNYYVALHQTKDTNLYVTNHTEIVAVINDHAPGNADWRDHRAVLNLEITPEWKTWTDKNKVPTIQKDFAQFIEDNIDEIAKPVGGELLDLVRHFRATTSADFTGVVTDDDGNSTVQYVQKSSAKAGSKGDMEVPKEIELLISPYQGGAPAKVRARLSFEITSGKLVLWYELLRVERILDAARDAIVKELSTVLKLALLYGKP